MRNGSDWAVHNRDEETYALCRWTVFTFPTLAFICKLFFGYPISMVQYVSVVRKAWIVRFSCYKLEGDNFVNDLARKMDANNKKMASLKTKWLLEARKILNKKTVRESNDFLQEVSMIQISKPMFPVEDGSSTGIPGSSHFIRNLTTTEYRMVRWLLEEPSRMWEDNINLDLREIG